VALANFFGFILLTTMPPLLYTYLRVLPPPEARYSPDQAAHYHDLGLQVWGSVTIRHSAGIRVIKFIFWICVSHEDDYLNTNLL
jgi:hypothetical protein